MSRRTAPRLRAWPAVGWLLVRLPLAWGATGTASIEITDFREIKEHAIGPSPEVTTPWVDITRDHDTPWWAFDLRIDEQGAVTAAKLKAGSMKWRDKAAEVARSLRFKPFVRDGRAVPVRLEYEIGARTADYAGPEDRTFPANPDPATTVIALSRTICMGSCPSYRVELRGNGDVYYEGNTGAVVRGRHEWRVDPASLAPLFELLRRANYFELGGYYDNELTDAPVFTTRVSIGDRHKFVYDYLGGDKNLPMPEIVSEIEDAIDKVAQVESFVSGDGSTMQKLRSEGWNFRSKDAGLGLQALAQACKTDLALEFVRAGAPVSIVVEDEDGEPAISSAARCGDIELTRSMIAKGALKRRSHAEMFLWWSAAAGQPALVELALPHFRDLDEKSEGSHTLLEVAASGRVYRDGEPGAATFDPAKVVEILIDAGADPNSRDHDGKTPLFSSNDASVTAMLLKKGADPNARDKYGRTALFNSYPVEPKRLLIDAGADVNARSQWGATALFYQDDPEAIELLLDAGADVNAADSAGKTAVEKLNSPSAFQALLAAGANLPADPVRLDAMIAKAAEHKMSEVLPILEAARAR